MYILMTYVYKDDFFFSRFYKNSIMQIKPTKMCIYATTWKSYMCTRVLYMYKSMCLVWHVQYSQFRYCICACTCISFSKKTFCGSFGISYKIAKDHDSTCIIGKPTNHLPTHKRLPLLQSFPLIPTSPLPFPSPLPTPPLFSSSHLFFYVTIFR